MTTTLPHAQSHSVCNSVYEFTTPNCRITQFSVIPCVLQRYTLCMPRRILKHRQN